MTVEQETPGWPEPFIRGWQGRFRHAQLVRLLHGALDADPARCLLEGISAGQTVDDVLEEFTVTGEFALAEMLLAESDAVSERVRTRLAELEPLRAERMSELTARLRALTGHAFAAGVPVEVDAMDLEALARVNWPAVEEILSAQQKRISDAISILRDELMTCNHSGDTEPRLRAAVDSLIAAGRLTLARRVLDDGTSDMEVPEAQPALPPWRWSEPVAEVLSWHVDPTRPKPPEFSAWRAVDQTAQDLIEAAEALGGGGQEAAKQFAFALARFLDPGCTEPAVHEFSGGWLSTVTIFEHAPLVSFRGVAGVDLLILPPGIESTPVLPGVIHYLAVGPDLPPPAGFRSGAAVLTMVDLLRLVTLQTGRAIGLARIVGRQWPLAALGVDSPASLDRLFSKDGERPWHLLGWLCNLVGVGGSATAEDLQFQGGDDAPVLYTLLMNLVDAVHATTDRGTARPDGTSHFHERRSIGVEGVVLRDCAGPSGRAAFWAALIAAPPGAPFSLDSMLIAAVLSPAGQDAEWESVLVTGLNTLREQWFVDQIDTGRMKLRPLGVLTGLRSLAERRLAECARELTTPALERPDDKPVTPWSWSSHRFALSQNWSAHERVRPSDADSNTEIKIDLNTDSDALIEAASHLSGSCDLGEVAGPLVLRAGQSFPAAEFVVEIPARTLVAVPERVVLTVLYELLDNAIEATDRAGRIFVSARADGADVFIDIFDDGPGLNSAITRSAQVFRPLFSTRGENRGTGLYLARRITDAVRGEIEVSDRSDGHPIFKGAHFTLILPGSS